MTLSKVAVIRDSNTGACFLVPLANHDDMDTERLEEGGYELSGWLQHEEQFNARQQFADTEDAETPAEPLYEGPFFTDCQHEGCPKLVMIIDDGAPEYCTDHTPEDE